MFDISSMRAGGNFPIKQSSDYTFAGMNALAVVAILGLFALASTHPGTNAFYALIGGETATVAALAAAIGIRVRSSIKDQHKPAESNPQKKEESVEQTPDTSPEAKAAFLRQISTAEPVQVNRRGLLQEILKQPAGLEEATKRELASASMYMINGQPIDLKNTEFAEKLAGITDRAADVMEIVKKSADPVFIRQKLDGFEKKDEIMALYTECRAQAVQQALNTSFARYVINQIIVSDLMAELHKRYTDVDLDIFCKQREQSKASSANTSFNVHYVNLQEHVTIEQCFEISDTSETNYYVKGTLKLNLQTGDAVITWTKPQTDPISLTKQVQA